MSHDYESIEMEHATAVAAAAFAIYSLGVSEIPQEMKTRDTTLPKTTSKVDYPRSPMSHFGSASKRLSGSFKTTRDQGNKATENLKKPEKTITPASSMKRTSTYSEKLKSKIDDEKPEIPAPKRIPTFGDMNTDDIKPETPQPNVPPPVQQPVSLKLPPPPPPPPPPSPPPIKQTSNLARQSTKQRKADAWEREELEKIKERYENLLETIASWETRKKMKARRKLNKHEQSDNERKKGKALRKYQEKMTYIDQIANGARAQADERRRNEVFKAKEKANVIRTTGKIPGPCSCF
ncbi:remorin-like isoform X2 [Abrus precatorius]|nr:remorin-like isoform X2 [Abrus precatorius]